MINNLNKDFIDFLNAKEESPPEYLSEKIVSAIKKDLEPSIKIIFVKFLLVQAFIGTLTLLFCPQFNLSLTHNYEVFHFLHNNLGKYWCMFTCGIVFIGTGSVFATLTISKNELLAIKNSIFLYYISISGISVFLFFILGANIYISVAIMWFLGAVSSGLLFFYIVHYLKYKVLKLIY